MNESISKAIAFKTEFIQDHPQHKEEVEDLFILMMDQIESGESEVNELQLFINDCNDLQLED